MPEEVRIYEKTPLMLVQNAKADFRSARIGFAMSLAPSKLCIDKQKHAWKAEPHWEQQELSDATFGDATQY